MNKFQKYELQARREIREKLPVDLSKIVFSYFKIIDERDIIFSRFIKRMEKYCKKEIKSIYDRILTTHPEYKDFFYNVVFKLDIKLIRQSGRNPRYMVDFKYGNFIFDLFAINAIDGQVHMEGTCHIDLIKEILSGVGDIELSNCGNLHNTRLKNKGYIHIKGQLKDFFFNMTGV